LDFVNEVVKRFAQASGIEDGQYTHRKKVFPDLQKSHAPMGISERVARPANK